MPLEQLFEAIDNNDSAKIQELFNHNNYEHNSLEEIRPNAKNSLGDSVIHLIISKINNHSITAELVKLLLDKGANIDIPNRINISPLSYALYKMNTKVANLLIECGADVNCFDLNRTTPLHLAAQFGFVDIVDKLLDKVQYINFCDYNRNTPLHLATLNNHIMIVDSLIKSGANVNIKNNDKLTSLHMAVSNGRETIVKLLLKEKNIDINSLDSTGKTSLYKAIDCKFWDIACLLLQQDSINVQPNHGTNHGRVELYNPLVKAVKGGNIEVVQLLLEKGASNNSHGENMDSPLSCAIRYGNAAIVELLIKHYAVTPTDYLHLAVNKDAYPEVIGVLLKSHININRPEGTFLDTPLHLVSRAGHTEVVKQLLDCGANANAIDCEGKTPLYNAVVNCDIGSVELLLAAGANPNIASRGITPLAISIREGFNKISNVLIEAGGSLTPSAKLVTDELIQSVIIKSEDLDPDEHANIHLIEQAGCAWVVGEEWN